MTGTLLLTLLAVSPGAPPGRLDLEPDELRPGLVAEYQSVIDPKAAVTRIEPKPAFSLGRSSPHPRIPSGPFEATWSGVITIKDAGPLSFSTIVGGEVAITVDGTTVLDGRGATETSRVAAKEPLKRTPGVYRIAIRYRSLPDVPARVQVWWEGPTFAAEPVPAWRLGHIAADRTPTVEAGEAAGRGKLAVGKLGCARCHASAFPAVTDSPPGPSLADANRRLTKPWLMTWLADPTVVRADARMPALFSSDRAGFVERWLVTESLTTGGAKRADEPAPGDHRRGRIAFLGLGCATCHFVPDIERKEQKDLGQFAYTGLGDRMTAADLVAFLGNPHSRYPDGRMPRVPVTPDEARDIAAYILLWSKPTEPAKVEPPTAAEIQEAVKRLGVPNQREAAAVLIRDKGCSSCHTGLGESKPRDVPIRDPGRGCVEGKTGPRFALSPDSRKEIAAYLVAAPAEQHASPFTARQERLARAGCVRCHQRDSDRPPPIEELGATLGGAHLQELPFLRTPRLTNPHQKFARAFLATTVREGVSGLRWSRFSYKMPAFGAQADDLMQALAEADGELATEPDPPVRPIADPTLGTVHGPQLAGFQGYGCASCHVWNGKLLASPDPIATGPDLTRTAGRIRRDWFDRYLEGPLRFHPGTPMPAVFEHGKPASLGHILGGDPAAQKDALWAYLARGAEAPSPAPPPPVPVDPPARGEPAIVAQIPIRLPDGKAVESISILTADHDLLVYDLGEGKPRAVFTGGQILRNVQGRIRQFHAAGTPVELKATPLAEIPSRGKPTTVALLGYDRAADSVVLRWRCTFGTDTVDMTETLRIETAKGMRRLVRELRSPAEIDPLTLNQDLPPAKPAPTWDGKPVNFPDAVEGSLERPGYRAIAYPRPKTISGEDRVMPGAIAVNPRTGQVFVASMKTGELFTLRNADDPKNARFTNDTRGLYQDALSMLADEKGLFVLHRRNLTKIAGDARFDRVAALPHGIADSYDMAYGLARDKLSRFVFGYAAYSDAKMSGAGGVLALSPGKPVEEVAFGLRNALGFCSGPEGEVFFTDNQGDWVAANKLCHVEPGKFYGWPNRSQPQHIAKPAGKAAVWVPYGWAHSINGVTYDTTSGKFGPFAGQFFLAELMFGGAIIRADLEKVNGVFQGACFPFWGKGLLGPLCLAFDPKGRLYVGGITEPGWMAQPDRGALYRIDFTGVMPFEIRTIRVRPQGFRIEFTSPVDRATAAKPESYRLEHYRYEYTGAYGSPELDRTAAKVERVEVAADGLSAELTASPLVKDRVYLLAAEGVRSPSGERLVQPVGAYTLHEIPAK